MNEMGKFIEEKVITEEEIILKNGMPALNLYSDRTHAYTGGKEVAIEYVQRANVPATHSVDSDTMHAKPLNSVHSKEVAWCMDEMNKLDDEKVITGDTGEEIILKNGVPAQSLYNDRTHASQEDAGLTGEKIVIDMHGGWGAHRCEQVYCIFLHAAKSVKKSELSKRCPVTRR